MAMTLIYRVSVTGAGVVSSTKKINGNEKERRMNVADER
jgi:hypothetical protein